MDFPAHQGLFFYKLQIPYAHKILLPVGSAHSLPLLEFHNYEFHIAAIVCQFLIIFPLGKEKDALHEPTAPKLL